MSENASSGDFPEGIISETHQNTLNQIHERRHQLIEPLWEKYQRGEYAVVPDNQPESKIELIRSGDLHVVGHGDVSRNELSSVDVVYNGAKDHPGVNFMGFDPAQRCLAFRGEARHLDVFIDFSNDLVPEERRQCVFKAPSAVMIPGGGLKRNLDYDAFAGQVEIVEYALWLTAPNLNEEALLGSLDTLTILSPEPEEILVNMRPNLHIDSHRGAAKPTVAVAHEESAVPEPSLTESALSDIPEEQEGADTDNQGPSDSVTIANQDDEMANGDVSEPDTGRENCAKQAEMVASQLEADAAMALSLSQALGNPTRYGLRKRNTTKNAEEASRPEKNESVPANTKKGKEKPPRATSPVKAPRKKAGGKASGTAPAKKTKLRRR